MKSILKRLNQKPIAYYPIYKDIAGSLTGGIFLSQLMFWFNIKEKFYKTDKELKKELNLTDNELRGAKKKIKNLDFITVGKEGLPAKTYYQIDWEKYQTCLVNSTKQVVLISQSANGDIHQATNKNTIKNINIEKEKIYKKKSWKNLEENERNQIIEEIKEIESSILPINDFINSLEAKGYQYADFVKAYQIWVSRAEKWNAGKTKQDSRDPNVVPSLNNLPPRDAYIVEEW